MQYFIAKDFLKIFLSSSSFSPPTFGHAEGSRPCCWVNTSETVTLLLQSKWFINFLLCISNLDSKQSRSYFLNVNLTYFIPWLIQIICPTGLYQELLYHHPIRGCRGGFCVDRRIRLLLWVVDVAGFHI